MRAGQERYRKTEKGKATNLKAMRRWREANPEAYRAHNILNGRVQRGSVVKSDACERCGAGGRIEGSHDDYSKPLDVEWLCRSCHMSKDGLV